MIISHKHRFIFIKTRKVGGTSLEIALSKFLGPCDIVTPISREDEELRRSKGFVASQNHQKRLSEFDPSDVYRATKDVLRAGRRLLGFSKPPIAWPNKYYNHIPAEHVRDRIGTKIWDSYFKFSIVRNPWDTAVSMYHFLIRNSKRNGNKSFKDFVLEGRAYLGSNFDYYNIDGIPALDRIIKYEFFDSELPKLSMDIGLPENLFETMKGIRAKGHHRKTRGYESFYDEETKRLIEIQFAREIRLFGYRF